jgi:hypothetical protein
MDQKFIDKFHENFTVLDKDECWEWEAAINKGGYGILNTYNAIDYGHSMIYAHRMSWIAHKGPIPEEMCVCHTCDNRSCVNPEHLFLGTYKDNNRDMIKKGRWVNGNPQKLTDNDITEAKKLRSAGVLMWDIAKKFGVCENTIYNHT